MRPELGVSWEVLNLVDDGDRQEGQVVNREHSQNSARIEDPEESLAIPRMEKNPTDQIPRKNKERRNCKKPKRRERGEQFEPDCVRLRQQLCLEVVTTKDQEESVSANSFEGRQILSFGINNLILAHMRSIQQSP